MDNIIKKINFGHFGRRPKKLVPALFLHLQKTAGTTIQNMARYHYGNESVISHDDYKSLGLDKCRKFPFVSGHFGIKFAKPLMENRFSFIFLRDPINRLLSLYRYYMSVPYGKCPIGDLAKNVDMSSFFDDIHGPDHHAIIWNHQATQLAYGWGNELVVDEDSNKPTKMSHDSILQIAKHNLTRFDYVGFVETFDKDIRIIFTKIGVRPKKIVNIHANATNKDEFTLESLPADIIAKLTTRNEIDKMLYDHALHRYGQKKNWISTIYDRLVKI